MYDGEYYECDCGVDGDCYLEWDLFVDVSGCRIDECGECG